MPAKRTRENPLTACMLTQQTDRKYFDWDDTDLDMLNNSAADITNVIHKRLDAAGIKCNEVYAVIHDKDERLRWDTVKLEYETVLKPRHIHALFKFEEPRPMLNDVARAIGVEPQYIEKPKKGRYAYDNLLAYLIHAKDEDKYQYEPNEVCNANYCAPYSEVYADKREAWMKGRGSKTAKQAKLDLDGLLSMILNGEVTKDQVILTDSYYRIYSHFSQKCEDAFRTYGERRAYKTLRAMQRGDFAMRCFYIQGEAGSGKTRMAKEFVKRLVQLPVAHGEEPWRVCSTAATNPMDEYNGEEILFMDDVRGTAMLASDWLKLLDPYNISPASARYKNRTPACRVVVITSTKDPLEFFYYCRMGGGNRSEAMDQFIRRIQMLTTVIRADDFTDTKLRLSESYEDAPYYARINGQDQDGNRTQKLLPMRYRFDYGNEYGLEDGVNEMIKCVEDATKEF